MFEVAFEEMTATVFVEEGAAGMAYMYGAADVQPGENKLRCAEGLALIRKLDRLQAGVPKHLHKKWCALRNQICFAFGPEMEAAI
ncbi:TPA: hypothetical protein ACPH4X_003809 [Pseudomonas aeruginosa]|jgi:hypothetical protein|uniref:hypothetical protein n=1 Tax=Pseudomonas aeruginosa TaxID=287 RepID=UPI0003B93C29|nr:hypothetical protein [Pseudomonas aeruginosa]EKU6312341.1 hypothetical protein [Pseudomonas aeruginosa]EKX2973792.1 hypothetical protein [Pseudomonas aeruginosa]EMB2824028.1 hypothetical protein [Pseudomonas aeruginosa]ERX93941.1 hypothetical protein Q077_06472 [Pseudomonas aeruginosa BL23]MBV5843158.1 hypothetical protein [Pseudomonas aeruginosa]